MSRNKPFQLYVQLETHAYCIPKSHHNQTLHISPQLDTATLEHIKALEMTSPDPAPAASSPLTSSAVVPPIHTSVYPGSGSWTILTKTIISAPLSSVIALSLDASAWPRWNSFISHVTILEQPSPTPLTSQKLEVGTVATFHARMKRDGPRSGAHGDHEVVTVEDFVKEGKKGFRIIWINDRLPGGVWMLKVSRVQESVEIDLEDGSTGTEYTTWGTFGGPAAWLMSWNGTKDDIRDRFADWANDLKAYAEESGK